MIEPSGKLQQIFDHSIEISKGLEHEYITLEHLLFSILEDSDTFELLTKLEADVNYIKTNVDHYLKNNLQDIKNSKADKPKKTHSVERVLNRCFTQVLFSGRQRIEVADVIASILSEKNSFGYFFLAKGGLTKEKFVKYFQESYSEEEEQETQVVTSSQVERIINTFCTNLTLQAKQRKIDPVIGRDEELEKVQLILARRNKCNVLLVGDPGVGKTAIARTLHLFLQCSFSRGSGRR